MRQLGGGGFSSYLANILLDDLDRELEKRRHSFARYADDFVILFRSQRAAKRVLKSITRYIELRLKLIVNQTKSKVCEIKESMFLGFTVVKNRIKWSEKSQAKFEARLREITKRTRGVSPCKVMEELQLYVRGAVNYYTIGMTYAEARELDGWLRRRVRLYYWKQWGGRRAEDHAPDGEIYYDSGSVAKPFTWQVEVGKAHGPAAAGSQNSKVRAAMTNEWLDQQGVPSIANQWISIRYPNGPKGRPENP